MGEETRAIMGEKEEVLCEPVHIRLVGMLVFSCVDMRQPRISMTAVIIEYSKLFMIFLLIGTIIGLSSFGTYRREFRD